MNILNLLRARTNSPQSYDPLIEITLDRQNLLNNLRTLQAGTGLTIAPVLKSNAYGHGLIPIGRVLDRERLPFLIIDSLFEALVLRGAGIKSNLLIMGYSRTKSILKKPQKKVAYTLLTLTQIKELSAKLNFTQEFHLKIDTGMHRQGLPPAEISQAVKLIKANPYLRVTGVYSHLADADTAGSTLTESQIKLWNRLSADLRAKLHTIKHLHLAASAGLSYSSTINSNLGRAGLSLYGIAPSVNPIADTKTDLYTNLKPALAMSTIVTGVKNLAPGQTVGYNATFKAPRAMRVATVPVGYFEGLDRRLSNKGQLVIKNRAVNIIGRISMNITSVDVSGLPAVREGEPISIISRDPKDPNSIVNQARLAHTIPYVLLVHIPPHLKRRVIN